MKRLAPFLVVLLGIALGAGGWYWKSRSGRSGPAPLSPEALQTQIVLRELAGLCAANQGGSAEQMDARLRALNAAQAKVAGLGAGAVPTLVETLTTPQDALEARYGLQFMALTEFQMRGLEALGQIDPPRAEDVCLKILTSTGIPPEVANTAARHLEKTREDGPSVWDKILEAARPLRPADPQRAGVLDHLDLTDHPGVRDWAAGRFKTEKDAEIRAKLIHTIARSRLEKYRDFYAGVLADARETESVRTQASIALCHLMRLSDVELFMEWTARDRHMDDPAGRRAAARVLGMWAGEQRIAARARECLEFDPDSEVRIRAGSELRQEETIEAARELMKAFEREKTSAMARKMARYLHRPALPEIRDWIVRKLKDAPDPARDEILVDLLGYQTGPSDLTLLKDLAAAVQSERVRKSLEKLVEQTGKERPKTAEQAPRNAAPSD